MIITITVMIIVHLGVGRNDKGHHGNYNTEQGGGDKVSIFNSIYYVANPFLGKSLCSDWFFLGQDFAVRTISMETVQSMYFCFGAKPANFFISLVYKMLSLECPLLNCTILKSNSALICKVKMYHHF